jgi:hypothetical protein
MRPPEAGKPQADRNDTKWVREKFQEAVIAAEFSFREITTTKRR